MTQQDDNDFQDWKNALQGKAVSKDFSPEEYQLLTAFREDVLWDSAVEEAAKVSKEETQASWEDFNHQFGDELKKLEPKAPVVPINRART